MDCPGIPTLDNAASPWLASGQRHPYLATFEITQRCNNLCTHCYLRPATRRAPADLPTEFWLELMDVLVDESTLFVAFTGGEPLLRADFADLYRGAKRRGLAPSVLTNGRLVDDAIADLMYELPPRQVSVSLYGATAETYERISGIPGSFDEMMGGIQRLADRDVPLRFKTVLLKSNCHELEQMQALADGFGEKLLFDAEVTPALDKDTRGLCERLAPETIVQIEMQSEDKRGAYRALCEDLASHPVNPRLFDCAAGLRNVHIDATGGAQPCASATGFVWPLDRSDMRGSFRRIFYEDILRAVQQVGGPDFPCGSCRLRALCGACAVARELEAGSACLPLQFGCQLAQFRARALGLDDALPARAAC